MPFSCIRRLSHLSAVLPFNRIHTGYGVQGHDPKEGLPTLRKEWVDKRVARGDTVFTQMHYAKKGIITEEMAFAAAREQLPAEFVRSEVNKPALFML